MKKFENTFFYIGITILFFVVIFLSIFLSKYAAFYADDIWLGLYGTDEQIFDPIIKNITFKEHGGGYLCMFLTKFFNSGLPFLLGFHPSDFISYGVGFIKGIILCVLFSIMANIVIPAKKSKMIYLSVFFITASYFFYYIIILVEAPCFSINHIFFRYIVPIIFFLIYWNYNFEICLTKEKQVTALKMVGILICGFIIETSIEILMYVSILLTVLIVFYNLCIFVICKLKTIEQNEILKNSLMLNLNKNFYIPAIFSTCVMFLYNFSSSYVNLVKTRGLDNINISYALINEFMHKFINLYIEKELFIWIVFGILVVISFNIAIKNKEIKKVILPLFLQISILVVYLSLILCGKTFYDSGDFWINHPSLICLYCLIIIISIYMYVGYIIDKNAKNKIVISKLFLSFSVILMIFIICANKNIRDEIENKRMAASLYSKVAKEGLYKAEKMMRFYYLKGETPYVPITTGNDDSYYWAYFWLWPLKINKDDQEICINLNTNEIPILDSYYKKIYKDSKSIEKDYCLSKDAEERFKKAGGIFTKEELENTKFYRLLDDDFIMNRKS